MGADNLSTEYITVSLVSHGHDTALVDLIAAILGQSQVARLVLTLNVPQDLDLPADDRLLVIRNASPKGFGQNHNQAFAHCVGDCFVVLNPDVGLTPGLFGALLACHQTTGAAIAAPVVYAADGARQDSWRAFPTLAGLAMKAMGRDVSLIAPQGEITYPDWVAGMCMLFDADVYQQLGGFDEAYFLYYEDVDICARAWLRGFSVAGCSNAQLVHDGQRASHRQWQHLRWHLASMLRYLWRYRGKLAKIVKPDDNSAHRAK